MKKISFATLQRKHKSLFWIGMLGPIYLFPYSIYTYYTIQTTWVLIALISVIVLTVILIRGYLIPPQPMLITKEDDNYKLIYTPFKSESLPKNDVKSIDLVANKLQIGTESKSYDISLGWLSYKEVQWLKQEIIQN